MCGIVGIVDLKQARPVDEELLRAMNDSLQHRGPDGDGVHVELGVGLGHRRLSIIDLEGGKQPMASIRRRPSWSGATAGGRSHR